MASACLYLYLLMDRYFFDLLRWTWDLIAWSAPPGAGARNSGKLIITRNATKKHKSHKRVFVMGFVLFLPLCGYP